MRITLAQLNFRIGDFEGNLRLMEESIQTAIQDQSDLICFSELATCGYPPGDFLEFKDFIKKSMTVVHELTKKWSQNIAIVVGAPTVNPNIEGKDLFNSAFFIADGKIKHITHKTLLPTYDIFDEYRHFEPGREFLTVLYKGKNIAITICEDIWNLGNQNPMYTICPLDEMQNQNIDFILNLSASPFNYNHPAERMHTIKANVLQYKVPMFYVNCVGAQTDIIFDGGSVVMSPSGSCFDEMPYFKTCIKTYDLNHVISGTITFEQNKNKIELIYGALVMGIKDYFSKLGFQKAILGLSGGIDSALTAVLAAEALGPENITALLMPSRFSSEGSVTDAKQLAENLGIEYHIIPIESCFNTFYDTLNPWFAHLKEDITEENIQARIRAILLMAFSNKFKCILLNTTNKSEMAVGYGTLYGDLCGGIAVLADVYKTQVYDLAHWVNKDRLKIPVNTIQKPPSAELRPNQKDSDSLPDYSILDPVLFQYIEERKGPEEIIDLGFERNLVHRILKLVNQAEFKRFQAPPVLRVSPKAFGYGRRLPLEGKYLS